MKKIIFALLAVPALASAQAPAVSHTAAALMGEYRLTVRERGSCYQEIRIIPEEFGNAPLGNNVCIYGLPYGEGFKVSQVLEINAGLRFDRHENPMAIFPFQSGFLGYMPRRADFDGTKLVYKTGELSKIKPFAIWEGKILETVLDGPVLKISEGVFDRESVSFETVCVYIRVK